MRLDIPDEILHAAGLSEAELRQELAVVLFRSQKITLGQASQIAGLNQLQFQHILASRQIPVHYDVAELEQDLRTLGEMNRT